MSTPIRASLLGTALGTALLGAALLVAATPLSPYPSPRVLAEASPERAEGAIKVTSLSHPNTNVRWGRASGMVQAPLADVMRVVEDYGKYHTFLPHFRTSKVLTKRGDAAIVYMEAVIAMNTMTLWAQMKMAPAPANGATRVIEAKMMKGNVNFLEARWELTPVDPQHTSVAFQLLLDPKVPLPASMLSNENAKASRKTISALRKNLAVQRDQTATL